MASLCSYGEGAGGVAQGEGATAVGAKGVNIQQGHVGGDVITGNVYYGPPTTDPAVALAIYRRVLVQSKKYLPLQGINVDASDPTRGQNPLGLAHVYVALDTNDAGAVRDDT